MYVWVSIIIYILKSRSLSLKRGLSPSEVIVKFGIAIGGSALHSRAKKDLLPFG